MNTQELRLHPSELRASEGKIFGHAAPYNRNSRPIPGIGIERILPGAFDRSLIASARGEQDLTLNASHNEVFTLGSVVMGNLRVFSDDIGLAFEAGPLPNTEYVRSAIEAVKAGRLNGCSFAFLPINERRAADGARELKEVFLNHITICRPELAAYPTAGAEYRSIGMYGDGMARTVTLEEVEAEIRKGEAEMQADRLRELSREEEEIRRRCRRVPTSEEVRREIAQEEAELQLKRRQYMAQAEREIRRQARVGSQFQGGECRMSQDPRYMSFQDLKDAAARLVKGPNDVIASMYYKRVAEEMRGNRGQRDFPETLAMAKFKRDMELEEGPGMGRTQAREIAKAMSSPYIKGHRTEVDRNPK